MPKAPDWLLNISADSPDLVEDSPQYRATEESGQIDNLSKATDQAIKLMQEKVDAAREENIQATQMAIERQKAATEQMQADMIAQQEADIAQKQAQIQQQKEATVEAKGQQLVQGQVAANQIQQQTQQADQVARGYAGYPEGFYPGEDVDPSAPEDEATSVIQLSKNLGLNPSVVAALTMLGKDMSRLEREGKLQKEPNPGMAPVGSMADSPVPLAGPTATASPGTPPEIPESAPTPMPMVPPGQPTPY